MARNDGPNRGRTVHDQRERLVAPLRARQGGVASRPQLRALGIDRFAVRNEVAARRWSVRGRHTVILGSIEPHGRLWSALLEARGGAVLDGAAALTAAGLANFSFAKVDVAIAWGSRASRGPLPGVVVHQPRQRGQVVVARWGLPIVEPAVAAVHAGQWAASDRQAALVLCMAVQQRVVDPSDLAERWSAVGRSPRKEFLDAVILAITNGVQALSELDFAGECRRRGLPEPTRQVIRQLPGRVAFLDAEFEEYGFAVEIDGSHHFEAAQSMEDMLRQNEVVMGGTPVLRIPVLGYLLRRDQFMGQVERFIAARGGVRLA